MSALWLTTLEATVTAICFFFIVVVYFIFIRILLNVIYGSPETIEVFGCGGEYWTVGFTSGGILLCTPISGAYIRICQICLLFSDVEMCFF